MVTLDTYKGLWEVSTLPAAAIEVVSKVIAISLQLTNPFCMAPIWIVIYPGGNFDTSNIKLLNRALLEA